MQIFKHSLSVLPVAVNVVSHPVESLASEVTTVLALLATVVVEVAVAVAVEVAVEVFSITAVINPSFILLFLKYNTPKNIININKINKTYSLLFILYKY